MTLAALQRLQASPKESTSSSCGPSPQEAWSPVVPSLSSGEPAALVGLNFRP